MNILSWGCPMGRKRTIECPENPFQVHPIRVIEVKDESICTEKRLSEVHAYLTQMVLLGRKKGRPLKDQQEIKDAA